MATGSYTSYATGASSGCGCGPSPEAEPEPRKRGNKPAGCGCTRAAAEIGPEGDEDYGLPPVADIPEEDLYGISNGDLAYFEDRHPSYTLGLQERRQPLIDALPSEQRKKRIAAAPTCADCRPAAIQRLADEGNARLQGLRDADLDLSAADFNDPDLEQSEAGFSDADFELSDADFGEALAVDRLMLPPEVIAEGIAKGEIIVGEDGKPRSVTTGGRPKPEEEEVPPPPPEGDCECELLCINTEKNVILPRPWTNECTAVPVPNSIGTNAYGQEIYTRFHPQRLELKLKSRGFADQVEVKLSTDAKGSANQIFFPAPQKFTSPPGSVNPISFIMKCEGSIKFDFMIPTPNQLSGGAVTVRAEVAGKVCEAKIHIPVVPVTVFLPVYRCKCKILECDPTEIHGSIDASLKPHFQGDFSGECEVELEGEGNRIHTGKIWCEEKSGSSWYKSPLLVFDRHEIEVNCPGKGEFQYWVNIFALYVHLLNTARFAFGYIPDAIELKIVVDFGGRVGRCERPIKLTFCSLLAAEEAAKDATNTLPTVSINGSFSNPHPHRLSSVEVVRKYNNENSDYGFLVEGDSEDSWGFVSITPTAQVELDKEFQEPGCCCVYVKDIDIEFNVAVWGTVSGASVRASSGYRNLQAAIANPAFAKELERQFLDAIAQLGLPKCEIRDEDSCNDFLASMQDQVDEALKMAFPRETSVSSGMGAFANVALASVGGYETPCLVKEVARLEEPRAVGTFIMGTKQPIWKMTNVREMYVGYKLSDRQIQKGLYSIGVLVTQAYLQADEAYDDICDAYCEISKIDCGPSFPTHLPVPGFEVDLFGWSRGAWMAVLVADKLNGVGCFCGGTQMWPVPVRFLGLFDIVTQSEANYVEEYLDIEDAIKNQTITIPGNVRNGYHVVRNIRRLLEKPETGDIGGWAEFLMFPITSGVPASSRTNWYERVAGVDMDHTDIGFDDRGSREHVNSAAQDAGVSVKPSDADTVEPSWSRVDQFISEKELKRYD